MDIIKSSDYIIDLGPEGGRAGGNLVFAGTPEEFVAAKTNSFTAPFLKKELFSIQNSKLIPCKYEKSDTNDQTMRSK